MKVLKINPLAKTKSDRFSIYDYLPEMDNDNLFFDLISSDSATDEWLDVESLRTDLIRHMNKVLSSTEIFILRNYYGIGCPQASYGVIASMIGKTRERTRQLHVQAIGKLRKSPYSSYLAIHLSAQLDEKCIDNQIVAAMDSFELIAAIIAIYKNIIAYINENVCQFKILSVLLWRSFI